MSDKELLIFLKDCNDHKCVKLDYYYYDTNTLNILLSKIDNLNEKEKAKLAEIKDWLVNNHCSKNCIIFKEKFGG